MYYSWGVSWLLVLTLVSCTPKSKREIIVRESMQNQNMIENPTGSDRHAVIGGEEEKSRATEDLASLFKKCKSAVFIIYTSDNETQYQGTGFFISPEGIAISNYHVFKNMIRGYETIVMDTGRELKVEKVLEQSEEYDFIIFKVATSDNVSFLRVNMQSMDVGDEVFAIGNPRGLEQTLSTGIISGFRLENSLIQTTAEITFGSSGGPLLNLRGEAIGITTSGIGEANLNFAINIKVLPLERYLNFGK